MERRLQSDVERHARTRAITIGQRYPVARCEMYQRSKGLADDCFHNGQSVQLVAKEVSPFLRSLDCGLSVAFAIEEVVKIKLQGKGKAKPSEEEVQITFVSNWERLVVSKKLFQT